MSKRGGKMFVISRIIAAVALALCLVAPELEAQRSDPQRDAEIGAFYQAGLPNALVRELDGIQTNRDQVNARVASFLDRVSSFRARVQDYNSSCAGQSRLTQSQAASCRNAALSLEQESSGLRQTGEQNNQDVQAVVNQYEGFKARANAWLSQRAAVASAESSQQAAGSSGPLAYQQGLTDATQCFPSNTAGFCSRFSGDEYAHCDNGYRQGFRDGDQIRGEAMQRAWQIGNDDVRASRDNASFDHPDAQGTCRIQWTEAYNRGHFEGRSP